MTVFHGRDCHATFPSPRLGVYAGGIGSWAFFDLEFLPAGCWPQVAVIADAGGDDCDLLRRWSVGVEKLGVKSPIGPTGAEALGAGSVAGPTVMRGIRGEVRREADDDGRGAENIAVPINNRAGRRGVDVDFLRRGLSSFGFWFWLRHDSASGQKQHRKDDGEVFHGWMERPGKLARGGEALRSGTKGRSIWVSVSGSSSLGKRKRSVLGAVAGFAKSEISQPSRETVVRPTRIPSGETSISMAADCPASEW